MSSEKQCRLCMGRSNLIHTVLDDNLLQKIAICVSIMINPADKLLPLDLCALCALKVKDFFEFRQNCLKVQQLLEQDVCSRNVQSVPQSAAPVATTVKQETVAAKPEEEHLQVPKFEMIIDEDERLSEIPDAEETLEEPDQLIEQLEDVADIVDEDDFVEDLVEQYEEILSEGDQTVESELVPESDIQAADVRDMDYEIQMIDMNFEQEIPPGAVIDEEDVVEFNDGEHFIENEDEKVEDQVQEVLPTESASQTSLDSCPVRNQKLPHERKRERDEKEIYRSLLQTCVTCGKSVERNRMEGHLNRHLDARPYICKHCGMAFHCKISLRLHTKNRHGTEELSCDLCGKIYFSKKGLYHHKKDSHAEKHFGCDECELVFVTKARLKRHKVTHTDEREFKCPHCPKEFYRSNNLKVHIRSHTKEKPFSCTSCDKSFGYQRLLREHMNRHHKDNLVL